MKTTRVKQLLGSDLLVVFLAWLAFMSLILCNAWYYDAAPCSWHKPFSGTSLYPDRCKR